MKCKGACSCQYKTATTTKPHKQSKESDTDDPDDPEIEGGGSYKFSMDKVPVYDDWVEEYIKKTNISGNMLRHCRCGIEFCPWCGK